MADFSFENQGTITYLVYTLSEEDSIDSMSLGMLTNNRIPGLAPAIFTQMDTTKYIKYNVSAKISVKQFFEGQVNKKRLLGVFNGIVDAMLSAEDYMIDTDTILLDLNYIFADVSTCDTVLICLPVFGQSKGVDLATFFKNIMFSTQFDQTENCDHVARIINYLNSTPVFSLIDFKSLLDSLSDRNASKQQTAVQQPKTRPVVSTQLTTDQPGGQSGQKTQYAPIQQPVQSIQRQESVTSVQQQLVQQPIQQPAQQPTQRKSVVASPAAEQAPVAPQQIEIPEKKISMFGLLMHYSKENKELYNAQKAAKKAAAKQGNVPVSKPQKEKKKQTPTTGFVVPGAPVNSSFDIPGQSTPIQQPQPVQTKPAPSKAPSQTTVNNNQTQARTSQPVSTYVPPVNPQGQSASFGDTTVLSGGGKIGETTVLGATSPDVQIRPHLIRTKNNERIYLDKPVFRIGKERSYVDYFVSDNTAVSRSHANIITRDGKYFIVDTNSTNHTYVNGGMIQSNVETPITHGAKIRLANEDFEFRLY